MHQSDYLKTKHYVLTVSCNAKIYHLHDLQCSIVTFFSLNEFCVNNNNNATYRQLSFYSKWFYASIC